MIPTFQSTLPVRGATLLPGAGLRPLPISIHAPREGSDAFQGNTVARKDQFQSTLPVRGATSLPLQIVKEDLISIHAPREGSDRDFHALLHGGHISIHAPREGSDLCWRCANAVPDRISIHAPREGSDRWP